MPRLRLPEEYAIISAACRFRIRQTLGMILFLLYPNRQKKIWSVRENANWNCIAAPQRPIHVSMSGLIWFGTARRFLCEMISILSADWKKIMFQEWSEFSNLFSRNTLSRFSLEIVCGWMFLLPVFRIFKYIQTEKVCWLTIQVQTLPETRSFWVKQFLLCISESHKKLPV